MTVGEAMERAEELRPGSRVAARTRQRWLCEVDGMLREKFFKNCPAGSYDAVGADNIYIFGESSEEVIEHYAKADYVSKDFYEADPELKAAVDFLVGEEMLAVGSEEHLTRLYNELLNKDWFMTFLDFKSYVKTKDQAFKDYEDRTAWAKKMLVNIAKAGFFSSDRTIAEYNRDIWHLK